MSWEKWDAEHRSAGVRETKASDFSTKVTSGGKHLGNINRQGGKHLAVTKVNGSLRAHEFTTHQGALNHIRKTHGLPTVSTKKTSYAIPPPPPGMRLPTARKTASAPTAAKKVAAPSHAFADWNAEHGHGAGGTSSADKIAASIRGALGAPSADKSKVTSTKGKSGSVISRAEGAKSTAAHVQKKDMKRLAPVKGEKDAADAFKTKIRMAAYNEKKKAALKGDPVDQHTPKTEQKINPHEGTTLQQAGNLTAAAFAASDEAKAKGTNAAHVKAAAAHEAAAKTAVNPGIKSIHLKAAAEHREATSSPSAKAAWAIKNTHAEQHSPKNSSSAAKIAATLAPATPKATNSDSAKLTAAADKSTPHTEVTLNPHTAPKAEAAKTATEKAFANPTVANHKAAELAVLEAAKESAAKGNASGASHWTQLAMLHGKKASELSKPSAPAKKVAALPMAPAPSAKKAAAPAVPKTAHTVPEPKQQKHAPNSAEGLADKADKATRLASKSPSYVNHQKAYEAHTAVLSALPPPGSITNTPQFKSREYHVMMQGYHRFAADHPSKVVPAGVVEEHKDSQAARLPKADAYQIHTAFMDTASRRSSQHLYDAIPGAHSSNLTPQQKLSVRSYTSSSYRDINSHLRGTNVAKGNDKSFIEGHVSNIDAAFDKQPALAHDLVTYRGTRSSDKLFGKVGEKVGGEFVDHGYTSTASHAAVGQSFGGDASSNTGTVLRILHPAGSKVLKPSNVGSFGDSEREVITPRGTRFHIAADRMVTLQNGKTQRQIDLVRK